MELELTEDQAFFVETTRRFLEAECSIPAVRELEHDPVGYDPKVWAQGAELGWTSLLVPEADGGGSFSEHGLLDLVLVAEEIGRAVAPVLHHHRAGVQALRRAPRAERAGALIAETILLNPGRETEALAPWRGQADAVMVDAHGRQHPTREHSIINGTLEDVVDDDDGRPANIAVPAFASGT